MFTDIVELVMEKGIGNMSAGNIVKDAHDAVDIAYCTRMGVDGSENMHKAHAKIDRAIEAKVREARAAGWDANVEAAKELAANARREENEACARVAANFHAGLFKPGEVRNAKEVYNAIATAIHARISKEEDDGPNT